MVSTMDSVDYELRQAGHNADTAQKHQPRDLEPQWSASLASIIVYPHRTGMTGGGGTGIIPEGTAPGVSGMPGGGGGCTNLSLFHCAIVAFLSSELMRFFFLLSWVRSSASSLFFFLAHVLWVVLVHLVNNPSLHRLRHMLDVHEVTETATCTACLMKGPAPSLPKISHW